MTDIDAVSSPGPGLKPNIADCDVAAVALWLPPQSVAFQERDDGSLCFFGGCIEQAETPHEAAVREIGEETSLMFEPSDIKSVDVFPRLLIPHRRCYLFVMRVANFEFEVFEGVGKAPIDLPACQTRVDMHEGVRYACRRLEDALNNPDNNF